MKDGKKMFVLFETVLAVLVFTLAFLMLRGSGEKNVPRISVIIRNPDDDQWSAFRYGLRMAAQDQGAELFVVSTGETMTVAEEQEAIEREIENRADAVIVQPVFGDDSEEMLRRAGKKVPVLLVEDTVREEGKICPFPVIKPDDASMGRALAEELLKDFSGGRKDDRYSDGDSAIRICDGPSQGVLRSAGGSGRRDRMVCQRIAGGGRGDAP